ncbi:M23 family metallopeptidase [Planktothrix sp. FACHB-1355]|uniref:M23 family metallopeptidase n=1 Tax=Aerosakkonema funiforme FACHB-1375 TaxID=2949571 RepID=A0A926ZJA2_9CYAN|nr:MULTISPECIES: M23 family metallopeptidase [Oscillatoriales]MBD2184805.1 M23 family metallopeptidase [Aerosakkonema funiforme FACHB-1375]MBD3557453.1 M23 family metallopeptidase [Planktothrix sp. FACHB-1355]
MTHKTVVVEGRTDPPQVGTPEFKEYVDRYGDPSLDDYEQAERIKQTLIWLNSNPADRAARELEEKLTAPIRELQTRLESFEQAWLSVEWSKVQQRTNLTLLWLIFACLVYINVIHPSLKIASAPTNFIRGAVGGVLSKIPVVGNALHSNKNGDSLKLSGHWGEKAGRGDKFAGGRRIAGSPWGLREKPCPTCSKFHRGQDVPMPIGTPLYAVGKRGEKVTVKCSATNSSGGLVGYNTAPSLGNVTLSVAHLSRSKQGTYTAGEVWGASGNSGASTGPHGHFAEKVDGVLVPPRRFGIEAFLTGKTLEGLK